MNKTIELLEAARVDYAKELIHNIAVSMASFIAEIDADSNAVTAYIEHRLNPLLGMMLADVRVRNALEEIVRNT